MEIIEDNEQISDINVTPFIDIMLVLLIVFMIISPLLTSSIHVNLPTTSEQSKQDENKPLIVYVKSSNEIYINDDKTALNNLENHLLTKTNNDKKTVIYFHADTDVSYGKIMNLIDKVTAIGYEKVALARKINDNE